MVSSRLRALRSWALGRREHWAVLAILAGLLCVAYGNVVFAGRSLVYTDNYNPLDYRWLPQNYGPGLVPASEWSEHNLLPYANFHDPGGSWWQWEPGGEFLRRGLQRGEWPWWDPYVAAGAPAMANLSQAFFFPPYFLEVALGDTSLLRNVYYLGCLLLAAFATYLLLRRHGLVREAALAGAVGTLFCGGLNQNVGSFIGQTAALLPVALLLTRWFLEAPSWRRTALLGLGYGLIALSSFPPILVAVFAVTAAYAATFIAGDADWRRRAGRYACAVGLSLGVVAFCYLPAFAAAGASRQAERVYEGAGLATIRWEAFSQLLSPVLLGGKAWASSPIWGGDINVPYTGVIVLLLAGLAAAAGRDARRLFAVVAASGVLIAFKMAGVQPVQQLGRLPGLDHIHFAHYLGIPLSMLLCWAAAFGLDRLLAGQVRARRLAWVAGGLGAVVLALPAFAYWRRVFSHPVAELWIERWYLLLGCFVLAAVFAALCRGARDDRRRRLWGVALLAVMAAEGVLNNAYPRQQRWDVWTHPPPYVRVLTAERERGRIFGAMALDANASSAFELFGLDSLMAFNPQRTFELYRRYAAPNAYLFLREASRLPPEGVLDAANIGLLALREAQAGMIGEAAARGHRSLWSDGEVRVLARATAPRYYFTSQYRVVSGAQALAAVAQQRPAREVLLEDRPAWPPSPNLAGDPAVVSRVGRNEVLLRLRAPRPGLVYCSESQAAGWRARVNGKPAPILAANYAFRAVPVPAGDVVIELSYFPPGLALGLSVSVLALVGIAVLALRREASAPAAPSDRRPARERPLAWRLAVAAAAVLAVAFLTADLSRRGPLLPPVAEPAPAQPVAETPAAETPAVDPIRPRPDSFYRVHWDEVRLPPELPAGQTVSVEVLFRNTGTETWPDPPTADPVRRDGTGAVRLSYRFLHADDDEPVTDYGSRFDLPMALPPNRELVLPVDVQLPAEPGRYRLQVDLVHELVGWFEQRGAETSLVPVTVGPGKG